MLLPLGGGPRSVDAVRELAVTIPWSVPPVTLLFRAVADRVEYVELRNG